ncbi:hypothetical protein CLOM_g10289 [Closterium sp. NIES-68]|nr:hypothetical protein CLOM_g10289 [Closterium sp. NIES-68]GJP78146.1 hypothetical protein CLOP_g8479 [Closterium sp. NIES-67]
MASNKAHSSRSRRPRLVAFNADGSRLATCMADNRLKVWDAVAGRLLVECADVANRVSADGQILPLGADSGEGARGHLELRYSCMAWAERARGEGEGKAGKEGKKRKGKGAAGAQSDPLVVLGTAYGDVIAWDVAMGAVAWQQHAVEPAGVVSLAFLPATAASPSIVYAAGTDGYVSELSAADGAVLSRFRGSKSPVSTIAVRAGADEESPALLMVGSSELKLYDAGSKKKIRKYSGHPGKVSSIAFSPDASFAFTAAEGDRHVAVWDCSEASKKRTSFAVLPLPEPPEFVVCAQGGGDEGSGFRVLALTAEGEAYVWAGATIPELARAQPVVVKGERVVKGAGQGQVRQGKKGREAILAAHLLGGVLGSPMIVARGILARPQFENVSLDEAQETDEGEPRVILLSAPEATDLLPAGGTGVRAEVGEGHGEVEEQEECAGRGKAGGKGGKKGRGGEAEDIGGVQVVGGMPMQATVLRTSLAEGGGAEGEKERKKKNKRKAAEEQAAALAPAAGTVAKSEGMEGVIAEGERTIEEQLKELGISASGLVIAPAAARKPESSALVLSKSPSRARAETLEVLAAPRAESLSVVVQQALEAGDMPLLCQCFEAAMTVRRRQLVLPTVRHLAPHLALKLVEVVAGRVQEHPAEARAMVPWMQAALTCHAGMLASAPAAHRALAALYQTVEARVAALRPMLELAGRLQLVVMAVRETKGEHDTGGEGVSGGHERGGVGGGGVRAATVYEEGDDSDVEVEDATGMGGEEDGYFEGDAWVEEDEEEDDEEGSEEEYEEEEERFMEDREEGDLMEEDEEGEGEDEE